MTKKIWSITFLVASILVVNSQLQAADEKTQSLDEAAKIISKSLDGYQWGGLVIQPEASLSGVYDSNILADRNDELEDFIRVLEASVEASSDWQKHKLAFDLGATQGRYDTNSSEDYEDYWANISGQIDISDNANVFGGLGYAFDHEQRGSLESLNAGINPTTFDSTNAHAGFTYSRGKSTLRAGGTVEQLEFDDALPINNQDRNRDLLGLGARLSYKLTPQRTVYVQGVSDLREYQLKTDSSGYMRDSSGYRADIGLLATLSNRLKGEIYLGHLFQDYDDPRFSSLSVPNFGGRLSWRAAPRTTWVARLDRSLEETTLSDASGYLYTQISGEVNHLVTPRISMNASASFAEAEFQGVDQTDDFINALIGMRYYMVPNWYLGAEYRVLTRNSTEEEAVNNPASIQAPSDFSRNQVYLTVGTLLYPVKKGTYWDAPSGELIRNNTSTLSGLYAGALIGHDTLYVRTSGARGGGIDNGQYSGSDISPGMFLGYGKALNKIYLGAEIIAETTNAEVFHSKDKTNSRTLAVKKDNTIGAALRLGYYMPTGPLLYGHLGAVKSSFDKYFTVNNALENAYDVRDEVNGFRYGVGMDVPVNDRVFLRFDYSHTNYDAYLADVVTEVEAIDLAEDLFSLGIGMQFDGNHVNKPITLPVKAGGPYWGAQVGYGALQSKLSGIHNENDGSGGSITSNFVGDFGGNSGATGGVFMGYGFNLKYGYIGLEGELENSTASWEHVRSPSGRNFSVEKKDSLGISLRGGYTLDNGSLVYARLGEVRTRFNTTWAKGGSSVNDVDRDDRVNGLRYGVGVEAPMTRTSFFRIDYSISDYNSYEFVSAHGQSDSMKFDNSEAVLRLGFGSKF